VARPGCGGPGDEAGPERLKIGKGSRPATRRTAAVVPAFSRMELAAPAVAIRPFAEVETTAGVKLRLFTATDQVLGLR